jgi:hypothetical protein
LRSRQNTGSTDTNLGQIKLDGTGYILPNDLSAEGGGYTVEYVPASGYSFVSWETTSGISVSSSTANTTFMTVSSPGGTLRAVYKTSSTITYSIHLESRQNTSATSNKGTIVFDGVSYSSLPTDISKEAKSYSISYTAASGYDFDHWETSGGISVASSNSRETTATVSSTGTSRTLTAVYIKRQGPSISEVKAFYTLDSFFLGNMPDLVKPNQYFIKGNNIARVEFSIYINGVKRLVQQRFL